MIKNYLLVTFRNMMKNKPFILINIFGMGVAVACCIVAYFIYEFDRSFDAMHLKGEKIYRVTSVREFDGELERYGTVPFPLGGAVAQNITDINRLSRFSFSWSDLKVDDNVFAAQMAYVDSNFFEMFTFEFIGGDPKALRDKSSIIIGDNLAIKLFGSTDVVGKMITQVMGGRLKEVRIAGVYREQPQNSSFHYRDSYMNYENIFDEYAEMREGDWRETNTLFVMIDDPARVDAVHKQLQTYVANNNRVREDFVINEFILDHFPEMGFIDRVEQTNSWTWSAPPIAAVPGTALMAGLILLIACFNLTNTTIAISSRRLKEIGIRKVMGSVRMQLVVQFIGETMVICFIALLIGLVMADFLTQGWNVLWMDMKIDPNYIESPGILYFLVGVLVFCALAAGSYPAFYVSKFEPVSILKDKVKFGGTNYFVRTLLGLQYAISLIAIVSAVAFIQNASYQRDYDLGFEAHGSVITYLNSQAEFETYRNALKENPDIATIAGSASGILSSFDRGTVKSGVKQLEVDIIEVGDDYFDAMDLKLIEGRDFIRDSETDLRESVIISQKMADTFGWQEAIGKELIWRDTVKLYVVGVISNVYTRGLWREMEPMMIRYIAPERYTQLIASAPAGRIDELNAFMEAKWKELFPNRLYNGNVLENELNEVAEVNGNLVSMFAFLGAIAMLLSATGLFTLVSLNIIKRMKEIGVRKVLGASIGNITRIINTEFFVILLLASLAGCVMSYLLTGWLMSTIWVYYQNTTLIAFLIAIVIMFAVSIATIAYKVFSAASTNPVNTLRSE